MKLFLIPQQINGISIETVISFTRVFQLFPIIFTCSQHFPKPSIAAAELQIHSQLQLLSGQLNDLLLAEKMLPFRAIFHRKMRLESIGNSGAQTLQAIYNI